MRLVINDILTEQDKAAFANGTQDNLPFFDLSDLEKLKSTLSERDTHFFECLSWLIKNDRLEVKIVAPKEGIGISHTKTGVFGDGVDYVAFDGSCNFSRSALIDNIESLTVSCEWDGNIEAEKAKDIKEDFETVFNGKDETIVYKTTEQVRTKLVEGFKDKSLMSLLEDEYKLIDQHANKKGLPSTVKRALEKAKQRVSTAINKIKEEKKAGEHDNEITEKVRPSFPYPSGPRIYQKQAFEEWKKNGQQGLFAMATGTGKTLTALNCLLEIYNRNGYYKALILVPTITLVEQWEKECRKFNFDNIVKVCSKYNNWKSSIANLTALELSTDNSNLISYIIICTYSSFARSSVFTSLNKFPNGKLLFVADEAHNMGGGEILKRLNDIAYLRRIGLSATPERQFDEEGNKRLMQFFGCDDGYTFEYSMEKAIQNGALCKYYYYPHIVRLTEKEMLEYYKISMRIVKLMGYSDDNSRELLKKLLLKRKRIIHKAENKQVVFKQIVEERFNKTGSLKYTLVYVPEGNKPDNEYADVFDKKDYLEENEEDKHLIDKYTSIIRDIDRRIVVRQFTSESVDREDMLRDFAEGKLHVLTSMKCLDEGVDVPRSEFAIFCSSTGNPRQFIQRRGRVLRTHPDKQYATIHDLIVLPYAGELPQGDLFTMERNMVEGEIKRVRDFALLSENCRSSIDELDEILEMYNISIFE